MEGSNQPKDKAEAKVFSETERNPDGLGQTDQTVPRSDSGGDHVDTRGLHSAGGDRGRQSGARHTTDDEQAAPVETYTSSQFTSLHYTTFNNIGKAVIINNLQSVAQPQALKERIDKLKQILSSLKFGPITARDVLREKADESGMEFKKLSYEDIISLMADASSDNYKDHHCFLAIILTYGEDGVLECADPKDRKVEVTTLQEFFKDKQTLNMKPKLFFVQAGERPKEMELPDGDQTTARRITTRKIPREADFFTYLYDMRQLHDEQAFLFLDVLLKALEEHVDQHLKAGREPLEINKLAIRMNGMLESGLKASGIEFDDKEFKIPCVTSLLTKFMKFNYGGKR